MNSAKLGHSFSAAANPTDWSAASPALQALWSRLVEWFQECPGAVVAYSGGVDSAVVAKIAGRLLGSRVLAATADSASLSRYEYQAAVELVPQLEVTHRVVATSEVSDPNYLQNDSQRCFHCKSHLFTRLSELPEVAQQGWWILTGTNADDLGDWRPGLEAARAFAVRAPLAELGIGKSQVRELAAAWQLPVSDKPASPCLASRIAYGVSVTPERLAMVEAAEAKLRALGFKQFRVRVHAGDLARIEVSPNDLACLIDPSIRNELVRAFGQIGFRYVTLDLEGFVSGSLNRLILPQLGKNS